MKLTEELRETGRKYLDRWLSLRLRYTGLPINIPDDPLGGLLVPRLALEDLQTSDGTNLNLLAMEVHAMTSWRQSGGPTYELTQSSAAALLLTDASKVLSNEVLWPYSALLITLPSPSPLTFSKNKDGEEEDVTEVFVFKRRWFVHAEQRKEFTNKLITALHQMETTGVFVAPAIQDTQCDDTLFLIAASNKTKDLVGATWPANKLSELFADVEEQEQQVTHTQPGTQRVPVKIILRLVVNLLLYLASRKEHKIPTPGKTRHQGQQLIFNVPLQDPDTGHIIKLSSELRAAARAWANKKAQPTRYKLATRIAVPGHYRHYYVGPRTANPREKVRRWILPYMYGDEASISMMKTYKIDEVPE